MTTLHGEIPCSHLIIHSHGARRRRCYHCGKTWVKWKRRRGRKLLRRRTSALRRTLLDGLTLTQQAKLRGVKRTTLGERHHALLETVSRRIQVSYPRGALLLIIDGLWFSFKRNFP